MGNWFWRIFPQKFPGQSVPIGAATRTKPSGASFAGQPGKLVGLRLLWQQLGSLSYHERQISSFNRKKSYGEYYTIKCKQRTLEDRGGKTQHSNRHHAGIRGLLSPFHDSPGRVSAYFSLNVRPAWGPLHSGCARGQCGHRTPRTCEGSEGDIKMNICV